MKVNRFIVRNVKRGLILSNGDWGACILVFGVTGTIFVPAAARALDLIILGQSLAVGFVIAGAFIGGWIGNIVFKALVLHTHISLDPDAFWEFYDCGWRPK